MKTPALGLGERYYTDGKHFRKSSSLSYRSRLKYPHYVGCALCAQHAKLIWKWKNRKT